jgi:hypothetical protein
MPARPVSWTLILACAVLGATVAAQTPAGPPGPLLVLSVIDIKPEFFAEFGELQAQTMEAQRKGGQAWRETWNVAQFGHPYRVGVLRPLTSFAELDGQSFTIKGAGADQARVINERARRMIVAQQIYALRARPDLGFGTRPEKVNLAVLTTVTVAPGRNAEFEALMRNEVMPAYKKAGEPYLAVSQVVLGGDPNQYLALTLYDDFAGLQKGSPILRALGPEGFAKFNQRMAGIVAHLQYEVVRYNAALSFRPTPSQR